MVMVRIGWQRVKLLFVIPTQERYIGKKLISVINVSLVIVYPHLKLVVSWQVCPDFEIELVNR